MFESAEVGHKLDKAEYEKEVPKLREALLERAVRPLRARAFQIVVLLVRDRRRRAGRDRQPAQRVDGPAPHPHHAFDRRNDSSASGRRGGATGGAAAAGASSRIFLSAWYHELLALRTAGRIDDGDLHRLLQEIRHLETMLADEGVLLVKLWFHLSRDDQRRRLKDLLDDPRTRWRVTDEDLAQLKTYDRYRDVAEHVLRETSTGEAPWMIVEGADARYRDVAAGRILLEALRERLDKPHARVRPVDRGTARLASRQRQAAARGGPLAPGRPEGLSEAAREAAGAPRPPHAAQEVRQAVDGDRVRGPRRGRQGLGDPPDHRRPRRAPVHDRAGRRADRRRAATALPVAVLAPAARATATSRSSTAPGTGGCWSSGSRGSAPPADWMRAYGEINDFEEQLLRSGTIVAKFWLQISKEEQLRRFKEREATPFKRFKITPEDWRNRKKWAAYEQAVADMIERTSTEIAPWTVVEAENKAFARVKVLRTLVRTLEAAL